eukprot:67369_1
MRHSFYANWGKYLRETIDCYGRSCDFEKEKILFYHGLSRKILFTVVFANFCGPLSTTLQYSTAVMFANQGTGNGIIITIMPSNDPLSTFFNCVPWSDFAHESEMLWLGGMAPLAIIDLTEVDTGISHHKYITPITLFQCAFIRGNQITFDGLEKHEKFIKSVLHSHSSHSFFDTNDP